MLVVPLCGRRVLARLEAIGVRGLGDLRGRDPYELLHSVNAAAGRTIWRPPLAVVALQNLVDAAGAAQSGSRVPAPRARARSSTTRANAASSAPTPRLQAATRRASEPRSSASPTLT